MHAENRLPVELHQRGLALGVDAPEGVDAEALHRAVGARDPAVGHVPHRVVLGLGVQGDEVPEGVVGALRLGDLPVGMRLAGVDDVGELDPVLDEEDRDVVADQVEGALLGVELRREPTGVAHRVGRPPRAQHGREANEDRRLDVLGQEAGLGDRPCVAVPDEDAVRPGTARVDHALRDALVVEVGDLLAQVVVLQQRRSALARLQRVVGVAQAGALGGGEEGALLADVGRRHVGLGARRRTTVRPAWSGFGGSGPLGFVGSSSVGGFGAGTPGMGGGTSSATFARAASAAWVTVLLTAFFTAFAALLVSAIRSSSEIGRLRTHDAVAYSPTEPCPETGRG